jgi:3-dehydroquinate dehydratase-2
VNDNSILLAHGPNLNTLGTREPKIYGSTSLGEIETAVRVLGAELGLQVDTLQSNSESVLVQEVQRAKGRYDAIILNAGALTHYSFALGDALAYYGGLVVEVHMSNVYARENWRHLSVVAPHAKGSIVGFGAVGYELAVRAVKQFLSNSL